MATLVATNPTLYSSQTTPQVVKVYAAAGTTSNWNPGQFLRINSSGQCVATADSGGAAGMQYFSITRRLNSAAEVAGYVDVMKVTSDMVFKGQVYNSGTVTAANIGQQYEIDVTSNVTSINTGEAAAVTEIVALGYQKDPALYDSADTNAVVYFRVLTAALDVAAS